MLTDYCTRAVTQPSKHLWLGNIPMRPDKAAIEYLFGSFGHVTSVRVFPGKTFAFVNFETAHEAEYAMKCLDGLHWPAVSGDVLPCDPLNPHRTTFPGSLHPEG